MPGQLQNVLLAAQLFESYKVDIGVFGVADVDNDGTMLDFSRR